jgi:hypothetical protein
VKSGYGCQGRQTKWKIDAFESDCFQGWSATCEYFTYVLAPVSFVILLLLLPVVFITIIIVVGYGTKGDLNKLQKWTSSGVEASKERGKVSPGAIAMNA